MKKKIIELNKENKKISEIAKQIPKYIMKKERIKHKGNIENIYQELKSSFKAAKSINDLDGLRFDWNDNSWIHIRPSNTEPIIRIYCEAKKQNQIDYLLKTVEDIVHRL